MIAYYLINVPGLTMYDLTEAAIRDLSNDGDLGPEELEMILRFASEVNISGTFGLDE